MKTRLATHLIVALLVFVACASWRPTLKAQQRRAVSSALRVCIENGRCVPWYTAACHAEAEATCKELHLERSCGGDALFADPAVCRR